MIGEKRRTAGLTTHVETSQGGAGPLPWCLLSSEVARNDWLLPGSPRIWQQKQALASVDLTIFGRDQTPSIGTVPQAVMQEIYFRDVALMALLLREKPFLLRRCHSNPHATFGSFAPLTNAMSSCGWCLNSLCTYAQIEKKRKAYFLNS